MKYSNPRRALVALLVLCIPLVLVGGAAGASVSTVPLGTSAAFAVLAGTGISDVPTSSLTGAVGVSPATGASITGLTCAEVNGHIYSVDAGGPLPCRETKPSLLTTATHDEGIAYTNAQNRSPNTTFAAGDNQLGGQILVPGVYRFGHATTANLSGNVTLVGSASSVWIFQATSDFITANSSTVTLTGGAQACNVFWQVSTHAGLGTSSSLKGTVLAGTNITVGSGVNVSGRLLAQAAVTLIADTITRSDCTAAIPPAVTPPASVTSASRQLYCDPVTGQSYNLEVGQDKLPPYAQLNLVPATVDPVTGAASCAIPAAAVTTATPATTTATTATTTTATTPTPAPAKPAAKKQPAKKHAIAGAHKTKVAKRHAPRAARHVPPRPAVHSFGITG